MIKTHNNGVNILVFIIRREPHATMTRATCGSRALGCLSVIYYILFLITLYL